MSLYFRKAMKTSVCLGQLCLFHLPVSTRHCVQMKESCQKHKCNSSLKTYMHATKPHTLPNSVSNFTLSSCSFLNDEKFLYIYIYIYMSFVYILIPVLLILNTKSFCPLKRTNNINFFFFCFVRLEPVF